VPTSAFGLCALKASADRADGIGSTANCMLKLVDELVTMLELFADVRAHMLEA
jgi:hypothetical protein